MIAVAFAAAAAVSWVMRVGFILAVPAGRLPEWLRRSLDHAGTAAMAALLVATLTHGSGGLASVSLPMLVATGVSGVVAWRTRRLGLTIVVALAVLVGLDWIAG